MDPQQFKNSLQEVSPPESISTYLKALWYDKKGDWEMAHNIAQDIADRKGSWIHAYLHRKEGDYSNAEYWYRKAGKEMPGSTLEIEWEQLVKELL